MADSPAGPPGCPQGSPRPQTPQECCPWAQSPAGRELPTGPGFSQRTSAVSAPTGWKISVRRHNEGLVPRQRPVRGRQRGPLTSPLQPGRPAKPSACSGAGAISAGGICPSVTLSLCPDGAKSSLSPCQLRRRGGSPVAETEAGAAAGPRARPPSMENLILVGAFSLRGQGRGLCPPPAVIFILLFLFNLAWDSSREQIPPWGFVAIEYRASPGAVRMHRTFLCLVTLARMPGCPSCVRQPAPGPGAVWALCPRSCQAASESLFQRVMESTCPLQRRLAVKCQRDAKVKNTAEQTTTEQH